MLKTAEVMEELFLHVVLVYPTKYNFCDEKCTTICGREIFADELRQ